MTSSTGSTSAVKWRGLTAAYSPSERTIMASLPVREQGIIHLLKANTAGEIGEGSERAVTTESPGAVGLGDAEMLSPTFIHHEDIEFGEPERKRLKPSEKLILLRWTWDKGKVCKSKKEAQAKMRTWKKWYERQGWKVYRVYTAPGDLDYEGFFADKGTERHSIAMKVYPKKLA